MSQSVKQGEMFLFFFCNNELAFEEIINFLSNLAIFSTIKTK